MARRKTKRSSLPPASSADRPASHAPSADRLRPWLLGAAAALFVTRPLFPSEAPDQGDGLAVVMLWIVLAAFWTLGAIARPRFRVSFGWTDLAVVVLLLLHSAAALHALPHASPRPAVNMLWQWIGLGLSFLVIRQLIVSAREARALAAVMIALAVALSAYGLYQYAYELPETRAAYAANPDQALRQAGLWYPPGSPTRALFESRLASTEPLATFALTNSLAGYLAPWLVIATGIALVSVFRSGATSCSSEKDVAGVLLAAGGSPRGSSAGATGALGATGCLSASVKTERDRLPRSWGQWRTLAAALCLIAPILLCLALTRSRTAWLATALGLLLIVWTTTALGRRLGWKLPLAALLVMITTVAILFSTGLGDRFLAGAARSLQYRIEYWQSTLEMIRDHPLWGCGPGQFQDAYTAYMLPQASEEVADPHNFLFEIWATAGTPAMLAFLAVLASFACTLRKQSRAVSARTLSSPDAPGPNHSPTSWWDTADAPGYVCAGAASGFLLSWPLAMTGTAPVGIVALLIGLPLATLAVAILSAWIRQGPFPVALPACGLATLLINLLAAGGITFPGVAGSLWLLMALALWAAQSNDRRTMPRALAAAALAIVLALAVACYTTAYRPVLHSLAALQKAHAIPSQAETHLLDAAAADPLSAAPWQQLAAYQFARWKQSPNAETFRTFEDADRKAAQLAPHSAWAWLTRGDRYLQAFQILRPQNQTYLDRATSAYREAVTLYPTSALAHAKLALALRESGDQAGFQREAQLALRLDQLTPHPEKKLPTELQDRLIRNTIRP